MFKCRFAQKQALEDLLGMPCFTKDTPVSLSLCDVLKVVCSVPLWGYKVLRPVDQEEQGHWYPA